MVNKHSNAQHNTTKIKPIDVKSSTYIDLNKANIKENAKFKVGNHVRISQYKYIFPKYYNPHWSEEVFVIKKVKNTAWYTYLIEDLNGEEIFGTFHEKEFQKTNQLGFRVEKAIKRKMIDYMLNRKTIIIPLTFGLSKNIQLYKMSQFPGMSGTHTHSKKSRN